MASQVHHAAFSPGNVAVITGASSGIGLAMAKKCQGLGLKVIMIDVNVERLEAAVAGLAGVAASSGEGGSLLAPKSMVVDVSSAAALQEARDAIVAEFGGVHVLHNNAGISGGRNGALAPVENWAATMGVNFTGVLNGCNAFVPGMIASGKPGLVINTGSKQGITFPPGNLAYNVSKAAVKAYTEGLEHELRDGRKQQAHGVSSFLLVPGWTNTAMTNPSGKPKAAGAWAPEQVVEYLLQKVASGDFYIICPDNETTEQVDNAKMLWEGSQIAERRPPLSRWHPDFKEQYEKFMKENVA